MQITHWFWAPGQTVAIDGVHPVTGRGLWSNESPEQIATRYPGAIPLATLDCDERCAQEARKKHRAGVPEIIDAERFHEMLNVLPPCKWSRGSAVEWFHVSERLTGDLVHWFVRIGDRYFQIAEEARVNPHTLVSTCEALS